ncbi:MAG: NAD(P)H-dependent glycerol-3-phosphate dehydrogenase, partial [Cetobacterium sp.]
KSMIMVAEGVPTVKAVYTKKLELGISMPIVEAIYAIIYEGADTKEKVKELMTRELKGEFY